MKNKTIGLFLMLLFIFSSFILVSCGTSEENNTIIQRTPTVEYGYDQKPDESRGIFEYMLAYKVEKEIATDEEAYRSDVKIRVSHGSVGPWVDGGYVYPDIQKIEVVLTHNGKSTLLYRDEYYNYISDCFFRYFQENFEYGRGYGEPALAAGKPVRFYTSDNYIGGGYILKFTNEEEYTVSFSRGTYTGSLTIELREIYGDGTVKVAKTATLYYSKTESTIKFSTEPFDEAE